MPCNAIHKQLTSIRVKFPWNCVNIIRNGRAMKHIFLTCFRSHTHSISLCHSHVLSLSLSSKFCIVINDEPEWCTAVQLKYFNSKNIKVITILPRTKHSKENYGINTNFIEYFAQTCEKNKPEIFSVWNQEKANAAINLTMSRRHIVKYLLPHFGIAKIWWIAWAEAVRTRTNSILESKCSMLSWYRWVMCTRRNNIMPQYIAYTLHS